MKRRALGTEVRRAIHIAGEEVARPRGDGWIGTDHLPVGTVAVSRDRRCTLGLDRLLAALVLAGPADPAIRVLQSLAVDPAAVDAAVRACWRDAGG